MLGVCAAITSAAVVWAEDAASQAMAHVQRRAWWCNTCSPSWVTWQRRDRKQFRSLCGSSRQRQLGVLPRPFAPPGVGLKIESVLHSFNATESAIIFPTRTICPADVYMPIQTPSQMLCWVPEGLFLVPVLGGKKDWVSCCWTSMPTCQCCGS